MSGVLRQRLLYGGTLLASVLGILYLDHLNESCLGFTILAGVLLVLGWLEYARMCGIASPALRAFGGLVILAALAYEWAAASRSILDGPPAERRVVLLALFMAYPAIAWVASFARAPSRDGFSSIALGSFGIFYLLGPGLCAFWLRQWGEEWALLLVLLVKGNDSGAYFAGSSLGRTPLSSISPKKTWEGAAGGLLSGILITLGLTTFGGLPPLPAATAITFGAAAGVAAQVGDLAESYLKRCFGTKDSGAWIPALGGALDLLDSLLFAAPVLYFLMIWRG